MPAVTGHASGRFCWAELATTDQEGAKAFYSKLFGWNASDFPIGENRFYTMLDLKGGHVGALYALDSEQKMKGIRPHWLGYVSVASADETAGKAKGLGGRVLSEPVDVYDSGRMAVLQDPTGAALAVWQPKKHFGVSLINELGTFCWQELLTTDVAKARAFYTSLFGWTTKGDASEYTEFVLGKESFAGMMKIKPEWGGRSSCWGLYFLVANCDVAADKARGLGGNLCNPPMDIESVGRFAVLSDPQGASFSVFQAAEAARK